MSNLNNIEPNNVSLSEGKLENIEEESDNDNKSNNEPKEDTTSHIDEDPVVQPLSLKNIILNSIIYVNYFLN